MRLTSVLFPGEDSFDWMGELDSGDLFGQPAIGVDQSIVGDAELVENGGVQVSNVDGILAPLLVMREEGWVTQVDQGVPNSG